MRTRIIYHPFDPARNRYFLGDREVAESEYRSAHADKSREALVSGRTADGHRPANWPMVSDALMVATEKQQRSIHAQAKARGVRLDFDRQGRPILESQGHRREVCELFGVTDRSAGYGDRVGNHLSDGR